MERWTERGASSFSDVSEKGKLMLKQAQDRFKAQGRLLEFGTCIKNVEPASHM